MTKFTKTMVLTLSILVLMLAGLSWAIFGGLDFQTARESKATQSSVETSQENSNFSGFVPHKALYDIRLAETRSGSQIVNVSGQMLYEWQPGCDAWTSNHRFNLYYEYADSPAMRIASDFSTFETYDGRSFNFSSQRKRNGQLYEELRGYASLDDEKKGEAVYTIPDGLRFDLPTGTVFPMQHTIEVYRHMIAGKNFYNAVVFDGSDEDGPVEINSFIGKEVNAMALINSNPAIDPKLVNTKARNVRLAFFPLNSNAASSDYEMALIFHENGVISDMFIEYDSFSVSQKLVALEKLEGTCHTEATATGR